MSHRNPEFTTATDRSSTHQDGPGSKWTALSISLGVMYLVGALAHIVLGMLFPEVYERFADRALLGVYTDLWRAYVVPNLSVLQPSVALLEAAIGISLLWRGRVVNLGHVAGGVFQIGLVLSGPWGPVNLLIATLHWLGMRKVPARTAIDRFRSATSG